MPTLPKSWAVLVLHSGRPDGKQRLTTKNTQEYNYQKPQHEVSIWEQAVLHGDDFFQGMVMLGVQLNNVAVGHWASLKNPSIALVAIWGNLRLFGILEPCVDTEICTASL